MTYVPRPNASGSTLANTRDQIRTNFELIQDRFEENHVGITGAAGGGKHTFLQMPDQASAPTTAANEGGVYVKAVSGASQLFYRKESNGTEIQITGTDPTAATQGKTFLPGGLVLIWDRITVGLATSNLTVTFPFGGFPTACFNVQLTTALNSNATVRMALDSTFGTNGITQTQFRTEQTNSASLQALYYIAIGN
jgi:tail fiber protein gp53